MLLRERLAKDKQAQINVYLLDVNCKMHLRNEESPARHTHGHTPMHIHTHKHTNKHLCTYTNTLTPKHADAHTHTVYSIIWTTKAAMGQV